MYSSPWLAVAVYARAPVADAPIATDIAANSDSTFTNSQGASSPLFTSWERFSTMCVWGEIGYAQMTSGRQSETASATAREPSTWRTAQPLHLVLNPVVGSLRRRHVALADGRREALADRARHGVERNGATQRSEAAEQRGVRHRSAGVLTRELARGHREQPLVTEALHEVAEAELVEV